MPRPPAHCMQSDLPGTAQAAHVSNWQPPSRSSQLSPPPKHPSTATRIFRGGKTPNPLGSRFPRQCEPLTPGSEGVSHSRSETPSASRVPVVLTPRGRSSRGASACACPRTGKSQRKLRARRGSEDNFNEVGRHVWDGQSSEGARDAVHGALVPRVLAADEVPSCELLRELRRASQQHRCSRAVSARW